MRKVFISTVFILAILAIVISCQNQQQIDLQNYMTSGKDIYQAKCQNCHGQNGEGFGELYPSLTDSVFLKTNKTKLACFIKNGSNDTLIVKGKAYTEKMPGFSTMPDIEIAQVMVYITNSFGNNQGFYHYQSVTEDLKNCK
ncbi:c-type cytochrome [Pedobacter sp. MW01-1-1]|uniref:c-type cytochrome n=1 Tax=Pedobacter sp. MW01-1-1 TaxID=3383027 RepID=UPI003FEE2FED